MDETDETGQALNQILEEMAMAREQANKGSSGTDPEKAHITADTLLIRTIGVLTPTDHVPTVIKILKLYKNMLKWYS